MGSRALVVVALAMLTPLSASSHDSEIYEDVAAYVGVPGDLLYAIALTESGMYKAGNVAPWPWTLNIEGAGKRYESREAMFDGLMAALKAGQSSVDIGVMQVNWYWQYDKLASPWSITDPTTNIKTGASILKEHYEQTGDWWEAVGRYHRPSQKPEHKAVALAYAGRVKKAMGHAHTAVKDSE